VASILYLILKICKIYDIIVTKKRLDGAFSKRLTLLWFLAKLVFSKPLCNESPQVAAGDGNGCMAQKK
jgi:hypothetical protein